jgi:hypothetical protein
VELHGFHRDLEQRGNVFSPLPFCDELQYLALARGERRRRSLARVPFRRMQRRVQYVFRDERSQ